MPLAQRQTHTHTHTEPAADDRLGGSSACWDSCHMYGVKSCSQWGEKKKAKSKYSTKNIHTHTGRGDLSKPTFSCHFLWFLLL